MPRSCVQSDAPSYDSNHWPNSNLPFKGSFLQIYSVYNTFELGFGKYSTGFGRAASSERLKRRFLWPRSLQKWRAVPDWPTLALPSSLQAAHQPHELINLSSDSQGSGAGFSTGQHSKAFLVRVSHSQNLRVRRVFSNTLKFSCQNLVAKLSASITRAACESIKQSRDFKVRVSRARPFEIFGENRTRNLIDHLLSLSVI